MAHGHFDAERIAATRNTARFFTENRHIAWVLLFFTLAWGVFGYMQIPKLKDPSIPVAVAVAITTWPGASAERVEQLVTRRIEEAIAENARVAKIESFSRSSVSVVRLTLHESVTETGKEFDDIKLKLDRVRDLPPGAGPIDFIKDFGDTAALMLVVASPKIGPVEVSLRARAIRNAIEGARARAHDPHAAGRASLVVCFPQSVSPKVPKRHRDAIAAFIAERGIGRDIQPVDGPGFAGVDGVFEQDDRTVLAFVRQAIEDRLHPSEFHPDVWNPILVRRPTELEARLAAVAGDKFSYRELDDFTDLIKRTLQAVPQVSKIFRAGILNEQVYLEYSQERLAGQQNELTHILAARNITLPGGMLEIGGRSLTIDPSGEFHSEAEIGDVIVGVSATGRPVYLRNSVDIVRSYETPPRYLNFYRWKDADGQWQRSRAVTLAIQMRGGEQIGTFGAAVDEALTGLRLHLPDDLILARVSDQPLQVSESIDLFMRSLYEAVLLVIVVAFIGFWEWRSAALIALSIPITLAMTFGMMHVLGIDLQQVSIASLIIALGLLVDDPVVAGDAIKRELDSGHRPIVASWLGPTKLATAILFATITNIVAYLPFLMLTGDRGRFLYSLPIVLTCALVASRIVSMSFIPLLGYYLLRPGSRAAPALKDRRARGLTGTYYRMTGWAIDHRFLALSAAVLVLGVGVFSVRNLKNQFFPKDLSYLSYVDVWLPEGTALAATNEVALAAERIIEQVAAEYGRRIPDANGQPKEILESLTTYTGGGGPRFWFSIFPELLQTNYAQIIIKVRDKEDTGHLVQPLQAALSAGIPGARLDVRQLETGAPIGVPVAIRLSGERMDVLRSLATELRDLLRSVPTADRGRDDWGAENFAVKLQVDPDRANFAGVSNLDVALWSAAGMTGFPLTTLREGDKQIPVVARLRVEERARLSDIQNLYVYPARGGGRKVPLRQISSVAYGMQTEKIVRRNQFRTITVGAFPTAGTLPFETMAAVRPALGDFERRLPPGYRMEVGGEEEEQVKGFRELSMVMGVSITGIFLALVFQFRHAVKPFIVFSAIPFGIVGALVALALAGAPFGFMAFLGVASLVGVIVSHVIVLFDFIEDMHERGEPLREALLDAGIVRLRPVMITVGATVIGLVPLALHGGPLWEPLCYAQIGGLLVATVTTLVLVPVLYAIFVLDLRMVRWNRIDATVDERPFPVGVEV